MINLLFGEMLGVIGEVVKGLLCSIDLFGVGECGYCLGVDICEFRLLVLKDFEVVGDWLDGEYDVDVVIVEVYLGIVYLYGIFMGGGFGLVLCFKWVEVCDDFVFVMLEMGIGLWFDVGVCFEFFWVLCFVGCYIVMIGVFIDVVLVLWVGLVDEVVDVDGEFVDVDLVVC